MMKTILSTFLFITMITSYSFSQELVRPTNHDPNFTKSTKKSFFQKKTDWQAIIDSTWGPGLPLQSKLNLFDAYATALTKECDGFLSLGLDFASWDSIRLHYRNQIDSSTSKGRFGALMTYLSFQLRDGHTVAADEVIVFQTPLNPGTPIFATSGFLTIEHCGAVITITPDSSVLVLRTVPNHPLGLQPGDIILGYEGIPYITIMHQLIAAELPRIWSEAGAASANFDFRLMGAAMNWHLFNTIDILQYSTGNILNLSTAPMINLNVPSMLNNEQVEIPGIPFPDYFNEQVVSYGLVNGTNIGYIYLFSEDQYFSPHPDQQFFQAVNALQNTEGLIIDMRWNEGGWAFFDNAFKILFNDSPFTLNGANRCNSSTLNLCPNNYSNLHRIKGNASSIYDHPIAILLGPTCVSLGDRTAHRFRYHPMVKFFGKAPAAHFGLSGYIYNFSNWYLRYSIEDMYHLNQPGEFLNRSEFPIDFPVWHNKDDAANGIDAVVEAALSWINNLAHAHDVKVNKTYARPGIDSVIVTAHVENPNQHEISIKTVIRNQDSTITDHVNLFDDGLHGDGAADDNLWGNIYHLTSAVEQFYTVSVKTNDISDETSRTLPNVTWFTSVGPVQYVADSLAGDDPYHPQIYITLQNNGSTATATGIEAILSALDTCVTTISNSAATYGNMPAGVTRVRDIYRLYFNQNCPVGTEVPLALSILSGGYPLWSDTFTVTIPPWNAIAAGTVLPNTFALYQNYPNPFNPTTTIQYQQPRASNVEITIFNLLGQQVWKKQFNRQAAGQHEINVDLSNHSSGIYFYRLDAGDFVQTRKMVLLK